MTRLGVRWADYSLGLARLIHPMQTSTSKGTPTSSPCHTQENLEEKSASCGPLSASMERNVEEKSGSSECTDKSRNLGNEKNRLPDITTVSKPIQNLKIEEKDDEQHPTESDRERICGTERNERVQSAGDQEEETSRQTSRIRADDETQCNDNSLAALSCGPESSLQASSRELSRSSFASSMVGLEEEYETALHHDESDDHTGHRPSSEFLQQSETIVEFVDETEVEIEFDETETDPGPSPEPYKNRLNEAIKREDPLSNGRLCFEEIRGLQMLPLEGKRKVMEHFDRCKETNVPVSWEFVKGLLVIEEEGEESIEYIVEEYDDDENDDEQGNGSIINSGSSYLGSDIPQQTNFDDQSFGSGFSLEAKSTLCGSSVTGFDLDETEYEEEEIVEELCCIAEVTQRKETWLESRHEWLTRQRHGRSMRQLRRSVNDNET